VPLGAEEDEGLESDLVRRSSLDIAFRDEARRRRQTAASRAHQESITANPINASQSIAASSAQQAIDRREIEMARATVPFVSDRAQDWPKSLDP